MKISVSLRDEDVHFLDSYVRTNGIASRSAAVHRAIRLLRASELAKDYAAAFEEWDDDGENRLWDIATADGFSRS